MSNSIKQALAIPLPMLMSGLIAPAPKAITTGTVYYMSFIQNAYPQINSTQAEIIRSSEDGPAFRYAHNPMIGTVYVKEYHGTNLYTKIPNPENLSILCIMYANFNRYANMFSEIVKDENSIALPGKYVELISTSPTITDNNNNIQTVVSDLIALSQNVLSTVDATAILNMDPTQLQLYTTTFPNEADQQTVCGMIQAYWILSQTQLLDSKWEDLPKNEIL